MLLVSLLLLAACALQDPRVPHDALPSSRHAVVPREEVASAELLELDADGSFLVDGKRFVTGSTADGDALESLEAWLASVARALPLDPRAGGGLHPAAGARRLGALRVRAHRDAPFERLRLVLDACTHERVGIQRVELAARPERDETREGWLALELPLDVERPRRGQELIGFRPQASPAWAAPFDRSRLELRVREEAGERELDYGLGASRYERLADLLPAARKLRTEAPHRVWLLVCDGPVRWGELVPALDLVLDLRAVPRFLRPVEAPR